MILVFNGIGPHCALYFEMYIETSFTGDPDRQAKSLSSHHHSYQNPLTSSESFQISIPVPMKKTFITNFKLGDTSIKAFDTTAGNDFSGKYRMLKCHWRNQCIVLKFLGNFHCY